jgi:hypothetical protein
VASDLSLELRTRHFPPLTVDAEGLAASAVAESSWLSRVVLGWLRPEVRVTHPFGVWVRAPWGAPGASTWPLVSLVAGGVLLVVVALAVVGAVTLARRAVR